MRNIPVNFGREVLINFAISLGLSFLTAFVTAYLIFVQLPEMPQ